MENNEKNLSQDEQEARIEYERLEEEKSTVNDNLDNDDLDPLEIFEVRKAELADTIQGIDLLKFSMESDQRTLGLLEKKKKHLEDLLGDTTKF